MPNHIPATTYQLFGLYYNQAHRQTRPAKITPQFRETFAVFKREILATIGTASLVGLEPAAVPVFRRYAAALNVDIDILVRAGVLLACLNQNNDPNEIVVAMFNMTIILTHLSRPIEPQENNLIELLTEEVNASGHQELLLVQELPGLCLAEPDRTVMH